MANIKKIHLSQLRVGMYIADLDCGWMAHPFWLSKFMVKTQQQIDMLHSEGICEFYIDTDKGLDVAVGIHIDDVNKNLDQEINKIIEDTVQVNAPVSFAVEFVRAKEIVLRTGIIVRNVLQDARMGQYFDVSPLYEIADELVSSLDRNPVALNVLSRVKEKDDYTFHHSVSVGLLMMVLNHYLGASRQTIIDVGIGGMLHDIGKTRVPAVILNKPGKLSADELAIMKLHVNYSANILAEHDILSDTTRAIVLEHHERFDGSGYPNALKGDEISLFGQQAAIVDVYDALTSDRCYHVAMSAPSAIRKIFEWSKYHFNPEVVKGFVRCFGIYPVGTLVALESGRLALVKEHNEQDLSRPKVLAFFDAKKNANIKPQLIDLSRLFGADGGDRIVGNEDFQKWGFKPARYLELLRHC